MPKTDEHGEPIDDELPSTLLRSDDKAQRTFAEAHDPAMDTYGDEERASRTAWSAVKHTHEMVGEHWQPKPDAGPSDAQAEGGLHTQDRRETWGGVDANATRAHLYERAKQLDIDGRSTMPKDEPVDALERASEREIRRAREGD